MGTARACPSIVSTRTFAGWVACVLAISAPAAAEPGFVWNAPATCPDGDDVRARIERRLGRALELRGIEVAISRDGDRFVARVNTRFVARVDTRVDTRGRNQIRTLTSARCEDLADAVAVVVARLASEWRPVEPAPLPIATFRGISIPVERHRATERWGGGMRAMALSGVGAMPRVGVGGELGGFVRRHDLFGELAIARWATRPSDLVDGAPRRFEVGLDVVALRAGWASATMPLRAWIGGELGTMTGRGVALADPRMGAARWAAATTGFAVAWPISPRVRLLGTFEVGIAFARPRFVLAEGGEIYQPSPAIARCALGFEVGWQ